MRKNTLLLVAVGVCMAWLTRCIVTQTLTYGFIPVNIFLAAVPIILEVPIRIVARRIAGVLQKFWLGLLGLLWVLFLPNAFYILTDFMHLNPAVLVNERGDQYRHLVHYARGDAMYVFDSLLVFSATAFGAYVGGLALLHAYKYLSKKLVPQYTRLVFALLLLSSSVGVYIGRFSRWNSWQGVTHPYQILVELAQDIANPIKRERLVIMVITLLIFELACFIYMLKRYPPKDTDES